MVVNRSTALAAAPNSGADSDRLFPMVRWHLLIAASLALVLCAFVGAGGVGAAAPTTYDSTTTCIPINYTTCVAPGGFATVTNPGIPTYVAPTYVAPNTTSSGYPPNTVISTYFDPRYCDGSVSVATDASGNLIDICTTTGQRIYPVFPDYGYGYGYGYGGYVAPAYVNGNYYYGNGFVNTGCPAGNFSCLYNGCPVGNFSCLGSAPYYYNGAYADIFTANGCPVGNFACLGYIPSGYYNGFTTTTGTTTNGVTTVTATTPGGGQVVIYNPKEVAQPSAATTTEQPVAAPAPAAPAAGMATALNPAPAQAPAASPDGTAVHALSAQTPTTPAAANNDGRDDGK